MKTIKLLLLLIMIQIFPTVLSAQIEREKTGDNYKYGFVDKYGKWVIPPQYDYAKWNSTQEYGDVEINGKYGMVNKSGNIIIPCKYKSLYVSYDNTVDVTDMKGNKGKLNIDGTVIIPCKYKDIIHFSTSDNYCAAINQNNQTEVFGKSDLKVICTFQRRYKYAFLSKDLSKPFTATDTDGKEYLVNYNGQELINDGYDDVIAYTDIPLVKVKNKGLNGAYNRKGLLIAKCAYDTVMYAGDNICIVVKGGKQINHKWVGGKRGYCSGGKEIIPCQYDEASAFNNDVATVKKDGKVSLLKNPLKEESSIKIADNNVSKKGKKVGAPVVSRYPSPNSDIDKNIPMVKTNDKSTEFAFIIANENYAEAPVPYALNDGRIFKEYCSKTLGLPAKNIFMYEDATFGTIISAVEKLKEIANAYDGEASVIVYYAGHGVPDEKNNSAYIMPVDGSSSDIETTGYGLAKFYKELSALNVKSAKVFLDACFSGAKREDEMLLSGRGVAIKVKDEVPQGNMVVFTASTGDETAHQLEDKGHGLFTYFLLKKIQETKGNISFGELSDYVTKQVKRQSVVINNKKQTPTVIPSPKVVNTWRNETLK